MIENRLLRSICHASIGTNDIAKAKLFYQPLLAVLGIELVSEYQHALAFGKGYPEFWVQLPFNKKVATSGNGVHFGFVANSTEQVDKFYQLALSLGGKCNGKPGGRIEYGEPYYGCFVVDPDGNKIEASYWHIDN
ncbi:VOC family protein [Thalassotalea sediminis]|uniref:VOC family protein n=1 Tax=Thalassotalea sediminis TaxID=1759089 RepID=UPI00257362D4|nr:VOC family protein [Thalassotalea sediminis]